MSGGTGMSDAQSPGLPPADPGVNRLDRHTRLCISLAARPSNVGTRFHNFLYAELGLNFVYKAFTTDDLAGAVTGIRALGIRGCGVSMPYKQDVIGMLDALDPSADAIGAVNTIVNDDGRLTGYNTDVLAVQALLPDGAGDDGPGPEPDSPGPGGPGSGARGAGGRSAGGRSALVAGSGGMAAAVVAALRRSGYTRITVAARNESTGTALAARFGIDRVRTVGERTADVLVNATPVGMAAAEPAAAAGRAEGSRPAGNADLPFPRHTIAAADTVMDVVAAPPRTPLIALAEEPGTHDGPGTRTVTGDAVMALQAAEQFRLYTGVRPGEDLVRRAREYSRRE